MRIWLISAVLPAFVGAGLLAFILEVFLEADGFGCWWWREYLHV